MDITKVCRTCLRIPQEPVSLFDNEILLEKITTVLTVQIENTNNLSTFICSNCLKLINDFYNFQKLAKNTNDDLNSRLQTLKTTNGLCKPKQLDYPDAVLYLILEESMNESEFEIKDDIIDLIETVDYANTIPAIQSLGHDTRKTNRHKKASTLYCCTICNQKFKTRNLLSSHKARKHFAKSICNICGIAVMPNSLKRHQLSHTGKPCKCDICGKICKHQVALQDHKNYNHREKLCACEYCGKTYPTMSWLREHIKYHTEPNKRLSRRKPCSVCGRSVEDFDKHMRSHTGEKPFICPHCNKGLSSSYALKLHSRLHTDERPYVCSVCNHPFRQLANLRSHLQNKH